MCRFKLYDSGLLIEDEAKGKTNAMWIPADQLEEVLDLLTQEEEQPQPIPLPRPVGRRGRPRRKIDEIVSAQDTINNDDTETEE